MAVRKPSEDAKVKALDLQNDPLFTTINNNFVYISNEFSKIIPSSSLSMQECLFKKFNPLRNLVSEEFDQFWQQFNIFTGLNIKWNIETTLSAQSYLKLTSDSTIFILAIAELLIGRFEVLDSKFNRAIQVKPKNYNDVNLKSWIILEYHGHLLQKILLTTNNDCDFENYISICEQTHRTIFYLANIQINQILQKDNGEYIPNENLRQVDIGLENRELIKRYSIGKTQMFDHRQNPKGEKSTIEQSRTHSKINQNESLLENTHPQSRREKVQINANAQKIFESPEIITLKNTCIEFQLTMNQDFLNTYRLRNWTSLLLYWHSISDESLKNRLFYNFLPYRNLNMLWKVNLEIEFIKYLQTLHYEVCKVYLYEIIRLSQGLAIHNVEEFYKLNCQITNCIIIPVSLEKYELPPFLSLMFVGSIDNEITYQLMVFRIIDLNSTVIQKDLYIKKIEEHQYKIYQINSVCDRKHLSELLIIFENNMIIPIYIIPKTKPTYPTTIVYVLYNLFKSSHTIRITFDVEQSHKMRNYNTFKVSESIRNDIKLNSQANIYEFLVPELENSLNYCLALHEQGFTSGRNFYEEEDKKRVLFNQPFNFVFNVNFIKKKTWRGIVNPDSTPLENLYKQFSHYYFKVVMKNSFESLPFLINQFSQINNDSNSEDNGQSEFLDSLDDYLENYCPETVDLEHLYSITCALGLINIKFCQRTKFNSLRKIVSSLPYNFFSMIIEWKKRSEYKESINGLQNLFILCQKYEFFQIYQIILQIRDYNLLFGFFIKMLKQLKKWKLFLDKPQILLLKECTYFFHEENQLIFINALFACIDDLNELLNLLNAHQFIDGHMMTKKFNKLLAKGDWSASEVHNTIYYICNLPNPLKLNIDSQLINGFIMRNLITDKNIKLENLNFYCSILDLTLSNKQLNIELELSVIERTLQILGFATSFKLINKLPKKIVAMLYGNWLKIISKNLLSDIQVIDVELIGIPEINKGLLKITADFLFNKYKADEILVSIEMSKLESLKMVLKDSYIAKATRDVKIFTEKSKFIAKLSDKHKFNCFLKDLAEALRQINAPSPEYLMNNILIRPTTQEFLIDIIKDKNNPRYALVWCSLCDFVNTFIADLTSQSVVLKTLHVIKAHNISESKIFKNYFKEVLKAQNSTTFDIFEEVLKQSLESLKKIQQNVMIATKIFTQFSEFSYLLSNHKEKFNIFLSSYMDMKLSLAAWPEIFDPLQVLVAKAYHASDSKLFQFYFKHEIKEVNPVDFTALFNSFLAVKMKLVSYFEKITSDIQRFRITDLYYVTKALSISDLNEEINTIANFTAIEHSKFLNFKNVLLKIDLDTNYLSIWEIYKFKDLLELKDKSSLLDLETWIVNRESLTIKDYLLKLDQNISNYVPEHPKCQRLLNLLITEIHESVKFIKFLSSMNQEEVDFLQDGVYTEGPGNKITADLILKLSNAWSFFILLRNFEGSIKEYFALIIDKMQSEKYREIVKNIQECKKYLKEIEDFNSNLNNQEQARLNKIKQIYENSSFSFLKSRKVKFTVKLCRNNEDKSNEAPLYLADLIELKDRAYLSKYIINEKDDQEIDRSRDLEIYDRFIELVEVIEEMIECMKVLNASLLRDLLNLSCNFVCIKGNFELAKQWCEYYKNNYNYWKILIKNLISKNYYLSFLCKKSICILRDYVFSEEPNNLVAITPYLKYMKKEPIENTHPPALPNEVPMQIDIMSNFLLSLKTDNSLDSFPNKADRKLIKHEPKSLLICHTNSFYQGILSIYYNTDKNVPKVDEVFFCHFSTEWIELKFFINRCFLRKFNLYTLVNPEELSLQNQNKVKSKILKFSKMNPSSNFLLALVTNDIKSNLVNYFIYQNEINIVKTHSFHLINENKLKEIALTIAEDIFVVTSERVGLGKTNYVHERLKKADKEYIEIDISGDLTNEVIGKILKKYQRTKPVFYHFQLNYLEDPTALHEFLFSISIFKQYYSSKSVFYIPDRSVVYIEIANTYKNSLFQSLPFISLLENVHISSFNLSNLTISDDIIYVCSYLHCYKNGTIDKYDLNFEKPLPKLLVDKSIPDLLKEFFIKDMINPTYHQFQTFIKVLSTLFHNFEKGSFTCEIINLQKKDFPRFAHQFNTVRSSLIRGIIDTTKEFTAKCTNFVNESQSFAISQLLDIKKNPANAKSAHEIDASLKWENSNHFTLMILDQGDFLCIYRDPKMVPEDYKSFLRIQKQIESKNDRINYSKSSSKGNNSARESSCLSIYETGKLKREMDRINTGNLSPSSRKNFQSGNLKNPRFNKYLQNSPSQSKVALKSRNPTEFLEEIEDYNNFGSNQLIDKLMTFYIKFSLRKERENHFEKLKRGVKSYDNLNMVNEARLHEIYKTGYILTPDNFLKMNLIYLRCISRVPIFIMGETGCGKTSLIRFFVKEILQEYLEIICIHTGITSEHIYEKMTKLNERAKSLHPERIWVFFDEFNTSDCVGMITNIICDKKIKDLSLSPNFVFLGACNPYRVKGILTKSDVGIKIKRNSNDNTSLVHIVKPLPDRALEFVWDFGTLKANEIKKYIISMLNCVENENKELFVTVLCAAHEFFQINEDFSSVSLRDINRFILLYNWFKKSISIRKEYPSNKFIKEIKNLRENLGILKNNDPLIAGILALFHCYFLRISVEDQRKQFFLFIEAKCKENNISILNRELIMSIIKAEQYDLISRMSVPEGTAYNSALLENIFAIVPCVFNKIPILICGKPGCSKSLSIQILASSLRGDKSTDEYFRTLPELQMISFQGSDTCTSEGIIQVFDRAKNFLKNVHNLPVVIFDEIGLAEISKHNPLKVLHELLEFENCKVGFIGISNWRLDSSKMNRTLFLARPDPDKNDIVETALTVYRSISGKNNEDHVKIISSLALGYFELKNNFKGSDFSDFYGLRDFYHMIKYASAKLNNAPKRKFLDIAATTIFRNFGGKVEGAKIMLDSFIKIYQPLQLKAIEEPKVKMMIGENLQEKNSRYLMIICSKNVSMYLIDGFLIRILKTPQIIRGSSFDSDISKDDLSFKVLSNIIRYMEQGLPIILQDMDIIYSSLYDLFNQSFIRLGKNDRRYCRIALGAQFNPRCFVHNDFKAIVFINDDDETIKQTDAPFLNRFEKHYVTTSDIFTSEVISIAKIINDWIEALFNLNEKSNLGITSIFPLYSKEASILKCYFLTIDLEDGDRVELKEDIIIKNKEFWIDTASTDLVLLCEMRNEDEPYVEQEKLFVVETWKKLKSISFVDFLQDILNLDHEKMIILTYDNDNIDQIIKERYEKIELNKCCNFKCENDVTVDLRKYYASKETELYLLELDFIKELKHLRHIIDLINGVESKVENLKKQKKNICIVIRMFRNDFNRQSLPLFNGWNYKLFENLSNSELQFFDTLSQFSMEDIIENKDIINWQIEWPDVVQSAIDTLKYQTCVYTYNNIIEHKLHLTKGLIEKSEISNIFWEKIAVTLRGEVNITKEKLLQSVFTDNRLISDSKSVKDAVKKFIVARFIEQLTKILIILEKSFSLPSLNFIQDKRMINLWKQTIQSLIITDIQVQQKYESNQVKFKGNFKTPFIYNDYENLKIYYKEQLNTTDYLDPLKFRDYHHNTSPLKSFILIYYQEENFQNDYIRDIVMIILNEASCTLNYLDIIIAIVQKMLWVNQFENKLIRLIKIQSKVVALHKLLEIYQDLRNEVPTWAKDVINTQGLKEEILIVDQYNAEYHESDSEVEYCEEETDNFIIKNKLQLCHLFNMITEKVAPSMETIRNGEVNVYLKSIEKFQYIFNSLNQSMDLPIKSQEQLNFCVKLCRLKLSFKVMIELCEEVMNHSKDYLSNQNFCKKILLNLNDLSKVSKDNVKRFKIYYFEVLLNNSEGYLELIVNEIINSDLWQYSSTLIQSIIKVSRIKSIIKKIEKEAKEINSIISSQNCIYFWKLFELLENMTLDSKFSMILCDKLEVVFDLSKMKASLEQIQAASKLYIEYLDSPLAIQNKITVIVCCSRLKVFLSHYSKLILLTEAEKSIDQKFFLKSIRETLNLSKNLTYELYIFKRIKEIFSYKIPKLMRTLRELEKSIMIKWQNDISAIDVVTSSSVFPCLGISHNIYISICMDLQGIIDDASFIDDFIIKAKDSPETKLLLALAFINHVFSKYKQDRFNFEPYKVWFEQKSAFIKSLLTQSYCIFIEFLIFNFPIDSILHLTPNVSTASFMEIQYILFIIAIALAFNTTCNPISSLIFNPNGSINTNLSDIFERFYFIGQVPERISDYLKSTLENYDSLKSTTFNDYYSKGGSYVCSNTCDYLYIINRCGGATEISKCPFCGNEIGGIKHRSVKRIGHRNLTDSKAVAFLNEKVAWYRANGKTGFDIFQDISLMSTVRDLQHKLTLNFLNAIPNILFYWLLVSNSTNIQSLEQALNDNMLTIKPKIEKNIKENFREFSRIESSSESCYWVFYCIARLPEIIPAFQQLPSLQSYRNNFEKAFESVIFQVSQVEAINQYKTLVNYFAQPSNLIKYIDELEIPYESTYSYCELFKITKSPSFNSMAQSFSISSRKSEMQSLQIFIDSYNEFKNLSRFWSILNFANKLVSILSFNITREEACKTPIKSIISKYNLIHSFTKFLQAWEGLNIQLINDCKTFNKIKLTEDCEIAYFLIDTDTNSLGRYITAALKSLGSIQNRLLQLCMDDRDGSRIAYPIQTLQKSDIIKLSFDLDQLSEACAMNCYEYAMGKEIIYDFDRIQLNIFRDLMNAKYLDLEEFDSIQYQYELLNTRGKYTGLVFEIRNITRQKALSLEMAQGYDKEINEKYIQESEVQKCCCDIYKWLEKALCSLRNVKATKNLKLGNLENFIHGQRKNEFVINDWSFSNLNVEYIISFYEFIELKCYRLISNSIAVQYKCELSESHTTKNELEILVSQLKKTDTPGVDKELCNVLKRMVIRMLTANVDENFEIDAYLVNESYWSQEYIIYIEKVEELFPKGYKLGQVFYLEELLSEIVQNFKESRIDEAQVIDKDEDIKFMKNKKKIRAHGHAKKLII